MPEFVNDREEFEHAIAGYTAGALNAMHDDDPETAWAFALLAIERRLAVLGKSLDNLFAAMP